MSTDKGVGYDVQKSILKYLPFEKRNIIVRDHAGLRGVHKDFLFNLRYISVDCSDPERFRFTIDDGESWTWIITDDHIEKSKHGMHPEKITHLPGLKNDKMIQLIEYYLNNSSLQTATIQISGLPSWNLTKPIKAKELRIDLKHETGSMGPLMSFIDSIDETSLKCIYIMSPEEQHSKLLEHRIFQKVQGVNVKIPNLDAQIVKKISSNYIFVWLERYPVSYETFQALAESLVDRPLDFKLAIHLKLGKFCGIIEDFCYKESWSWKQLPDGRICASYDFNGMELNVSRITHSLGMQVYEKGTAKSLSPKFIEMHKQIYSEKMEIQRKRQMPIGYMFDNIVINLEDLQLTLDESVFDFEECLHLCATIEDILEPPHISTRVMEIKGFSEHFTLTPSIYVEELRIDSTGIFREYIFETFTENPPKRIVVNSMQTVQYAPEQIRSVVTINNQKKTEKIVETTDISRNHESVEVVTSIEHEGFSGSMTTSRKRPSQTYVDATEVQAQLLKAELEVLQKKAKNLDSVAEQSEIQKTETKTSC